LQKNGQQKYSAFLFFQLFSLKIVASKFIESASATGIFLNFKVKSSAFLDLVLRNVIESKDRYGYVNLGAGKAPIVVEYSSPNIAKPFHAGHLRSTIIGNFVAKLHTAMGYPVVRINWLGDWGKQYGLLALGYKRYGDDEKLKTQPLRHLYEIYVKINQDKKAEEDAERERLAKEAPKPQAEEKKEESTGEKKIEEKVSDIVDCQINRDAKEYFKRMEDNDKEAIELWTRFRDMSIIELNKTYERLNVDFDVVTGESAMQGANVGFVEEKLKEKGLLVEKNGALIVDLSQWKLGDVVLRKKDGTTVYIARDIVSSIQRWEKYHFEKMYFVVAASQSLHFQQMFKILELMGYEWASRCVHLAFGMVKGISTRSGTAVFLDDILNEAARNMHEQMKVNEEKMDTIDNPEKIADVIGVSAVVVQDFNARRIKDYDFDWKRMTSFEGHTGPYLQYAHARLCSIIRKNTDVPVNPKADLSLLTEPEAIELATQIARFPDVLQVCTEQLEAVPLIMYLYELAYAVSMAHRGLWVKGRELPVAEARVLLFDIARSVMSQGLTMIGLTPLERM
jgi:arginyl-tRNA synthetase